MNQDDTRYRETMYSQIDVTQPTYPTPTTAHRPGESEASHLLRALVAGQQRQNELLQQLIGQLSAAQRHRQNELGQWKQNNPRLARSCRAAADALGKVQTEFLDSLTQEIHDSYENLLDGEFMLTEFIDRFGPRMAHLNGLLQVLSQLGATPETANAPNASS
jgi:hypothetical protein